MLLWASVPSFRTSRLDPLKLHDKAKDMLMWLTIIKQKEVVVNVAI